MTIKVWQLNDCDWIAARTLTEAIDCYLETSGDSREEALAHEPHALTEGQMHRLTFVTEDAEPEAPGSYKRHSFAVELARLIAAGATFPRFFASTEI